MWFICFAHGQHKFCSFNFCEWLNSRKTHEKTPCKNYQPKLPSIHSTDSAVLTTLSMACVGNNSIIKTTPVTPQIVHHSEHDHTFQALSSFWDKDLGMRVVYMLQSVHLTQQDCKYLTDHYLLFVEVY